ncbi:MAG TPA: hypothetical protein VG897_15425 [Terriglobales bacterium]|nr:hypothetical protein [Terriglobales bacterium]
MTVDIEQLQIDLNDLLMQREHESANLAQLLTIRQRLQEATDRLSQSLSDDLAMLAQHISRFYRPPPQVESHDDAAAYAQRFAPALRSEEFANQIFNQADRLQ